MMKRRYEIKINGIVQGVGFRPFIYNLAKSLSLNGWVGNIGSEVIIEIEADTSSMNNFIDRIKNEAPPLSHIKNINITNKPLFGYSDFCIEESSRSMEKKVYISPDVSICKDCENELFDKSNHRYLYPFINCTNCGPRFTIIKDVPYDRLSTTMQKFEMCKQCRKEYTDPADRRYHAQPVSCFECGPVLQLMDKELNNCDTDNIILYTRKLLSDGKIVAIKGLGGYHLACDALNDHAVASLRKRKIRDDKPFAVMFRDYGSVMKYCHMNNFERKLLESEKRPIVLLRKRDGLNLAQSISPGNPTLGVMLPYTPIHMLLLSSPEKIGLGVNTAAPEALVMTSGNRSNEPIYYDDGDAFENLRDIADYFLTNDREIHIRTDDSVTRVFREKEYILRRSRGYVPFPITCDFLNKYSDNLPSVLACGGEQKNTFCMNKDSEFFLSHHIGDLENAETLQSFEEGIEHFKKLFSIKYRTIAYDLHPEYLSTKYAKNTHISSRYAIQHHHAHIASCMAENNLDEDVIGVAFDGTGFGEDGHLWGGEFFTGGYRGFKRAAHLEYVKMPGGEKAVKEPWRMSLSYLYSTGAGLTTTDELNGVQFEGITLLDTVPNEKLNLVIQMLDRNLNSPLTSSMGRLFDAVSALLGIRTVVTYEGQAAIEMEYISDVNRAGSYNYTIFNSNGVLKVFARDIIKDIIIDIKNNVDKKVIASKFHDTIANIVLDVCLKLKAESSITKIVLSGGVFQNMILLDKCISRLEKSGFVVYIHSRLPANDGGIALGQAVMSVFKNMKG